jgi:hypothetical protein
VNGLYKTELIRGPDQGPWRTVDDVELATLGWVHWFNTDRLHEALGDTPPAEFEARWHEANERATLSGHHSPAGSPDDTSHPTEQAARGPAYGRRRRTQRGRGRWPGRSRSGA